MSTEIGQGFRGPKGRLGFLLRQAQQAMRSAIDGEVRTLGITAPQYSVLSVVRHEPGLSPSGVADQSMLRQQTVSEIVGTLERLGLIERRPHPTDRRAMRVFLTTSGVSTLRKADARVARLEKESAVGLSAAERDLVARWLVDCARMFSRPPARRR